MWNAELDELQTGIKIAGRNINNLRYADDTTLMAESEGELWSFLMKMKEESKKLGLKLNIKETKIMESGPIAVWQKNEKKWKQWQTVFSGSKVTADSDCSHEIKNLAPWKESYDQPRQYIKMQRHHSVNKNP